VLGWLGWEARGGSKKREIKVLGHIPERRGCFKAYGHCLRRLSRSDPPFNPLSGITMPPLPWASRRTGRHETLLPANHVPIFRPSYRFRQASPHLLLAVRLEAGVDRNMHVCLLDVFEVEARLSWYSRLCHGRQARHLLSIHSLSRLASLLHADDHDILASSRLHEALPHLFERV